MPRYRSLVPVADKLSSYAICFVIVTVYGPETVSAIAASPSCPIRRRPTSWCRPATSPA